MCLKVYPQRNNQRGKTGSGNLEWTWGNGTAVWGDLHNLLE